MLKVVNPFKQESPLAPPPPPPPPFAAIYCGIKRKLFWAEVQLPAVESIRELTASVPVCANTHTQTSTHPNDLSMLSKYPNLYLIHSYALQDALGCFRTRSE